MRGGGSLRGGVDRVCCRIEDDHWRATAQGDRDRSGSRRLSRGRGAGECGRGDGCGRGTRVPCAGEAVPRGQEDHREDEAEHEQPHGYLEGDRVAVRGCDRRGLWAGAVRGQVGDLALSAIVLSTEVPIDPPTCCMVLTRAEATPESSGATPAVAVLIP